MLDTLKDKSMALYSNKSPLNSDSDSLKNLKVNPIYSKIKLAKTTRNLMGPKDYHQCLTHQHLRDMLLVRRMSPRRRKHQIVSILEALITFPLSKSPTS